MSKFKKVLVFGLIVLSLILFCIPVKSYVDIKLENNEIFEDVISEGNVSNDEASDDFVIDWERLLSINPNIIAWIYTPGTNINYPIVRSSYVETGAGQEIDCLRKNIYGDYSKAGCIFVKPDTSEFFDYSTVIYGHNLNNGLMFSQLVKYKSNDFMNSHRFVYIYFPDNSVKTYSIYSFMTCQVDDEIYDSSDYDDDCEIILSTCTNTAKSKRYVVFGKSV